jgi:hypothetical protein
LTSTNAKSHGATKHELRPFLTAVEAIQVNHAMKKVALASQGQVKFFNLSTWQEEVADRIDISKGAGTVT